MGQIAKDRIEIGVVLQGGGALGAYEFGAMIALLELMDEIDIPGRSVRLTAVTGVSIGAINDASFWDGGVIDNTPLGDAIEAFSGSDDVDRILVVMNLFRKKRATPKNMIEVNDRLSELRYGNRLRQDGANAAVISELLQTV